LSPARRGRRTDGPSRLVPVDGLWERRCRVGVVKPHASADRTADTTRGDTVPCGRIANPTRKSNRMRYENVSPFRFTAISFDDSGSQIRAVYGKGARPARRAVECAAMGPGHAPPHTRTRQPRSRKMPSAGGTIAVLPRLPCPSSISYIVAPPSLRVA
jgi:hypothetical protein